MSHEAIEAIIENLSHDGRGITHIEGKVTFVEGALPGEKVSIELRNKRGKFNEAKVVDVLMASSERVNAKCQHFGVCGGCSLQHLNPESQLQFKQKHLLEQFKHFGKIEPQAILPPLTGPIWNYRRKARLGVKYVAKKQKVLVGFREKDSRFLADLTQCEVLSEPVASMLPALSELIASLSIYQHIPQVEVAMGDDVCALIFRHMQPCSQSDIETFIAFAKAHNVHLYLQPKGLDSIHLLYPKAAVETISYHLPEHDLELQFHPNQFAQVNPAINQKMLARAIELLELHESDRVLDLYCGFGNFSLPLAKHCAKVVGVEGVQFAVDSATDNAKHNQLENTEFFCADLTHNFANSPWAKQAYDKILLDPARSGAENIVNHIEVFHAKHIVYVSCNPATLARDAGILVHQKGYTLTQAGIMDMFPHTSHVESIAVFKKSI